MVAASSTRNSLFSAVGRNALPSTYRRRQRRNQDDQRSPNSPVLRGLLRTIRRAAVNSCPNLGRLFPRLTFHPSSRFSVAISGQSLGLPTNSSSGRGIRAATVQFANFLVEEAGAGTEQTTFPWDSVPVRWKPASNSTFSTGCQGRARTGCEATSEGRSERNTSWKRSKTSCSGACSSDLPCC